MFPSHDPQGVDLSAYTSEDILKARQLIRDRFNSARLANRDDVVKQVLDMQAKGQGFDEIEDSIRDATVSPAFTEPYLRALRSLSINLDKRQAETLEILMEGALRKGRPEIATDELLSGFVKGKTGTQLGQFQNRQQLVSSLVEIQQGLNALEQIGLKIGVGTAIEEWMANHDRDWETLNES